MNPQLLVLSGVADVRDRFLRALAGLDEASESADAGTRTVLLAYRRRVQELLVEQMGIIADHIEGLRAGFGDDPAGWDPTELGDLSDATVRAFDLLAMSHYDLATHLPALAHARDDLQYMLMRGLDLSLMSREHTRLLSVQQSPTLAWAATRFTRLQVAGPTAAAIAVPWLETRTPLRWPLAVHELGHFFLPGGNADLAKPIVRQVAEENGWRDNDLTSFEEIVADAVAQHAVGDAYGFALAREGYLLSHETHLAGGVSVETRVRLLGSPRTLIENLPSVWGLDRLSPRGKPAPAETPRDASEAMREAALRMVGPLPLSNGEAVREARRLIRGDEPPTAVLTIGADDTASLASLAEALKTGSTDSMSNEDLDNVTDLAVHRMLTDGEILEAAWLEDCDREVNALLETLSTEPTPDKLDEASRVVAARDTWLARALEAAAVHRWLDSSAALEEGR